MSDPTVSPESDPQPTVIGPEDPRYPGSEDPLIKQLEEDDVEGVDSKRTDDPPVAQSG